MKQKYTITIADVQMNIITDESKEAVESIVGILDRRIREIYLQSGNRCPKNEAALLCALDYCAERNKLQETVTQLETALKNNEIDQVRAEKAALSEELEGVKNTLAETQEKLRAAEAEVGLSGEQVRILTQKVIRSDENTEIRGAKLAEAEAKIAELEARIAELEAAPALEAAEIEESLAELEAVEMIEEENAAKTVQDIAPEQAAGEPTEPVEPVEPVEAAESAEPAPVEPAEPATTSEKTPVSELADELAAPAPIEMKPLRSNVDENQLTIEGTIAEKSDESEKNLSDSKVMEKEKQKAQKRVRSMFDLITFDNV